jgi:hypothetical protein
VELPRGVLTTLFYDLTKSSTVRYRFDDSIETFEDDGTGVEVGFKSGEDRRYDVVVGADGLHSNTRRLVFGPEEPFRRDLGFSFSLFSMPNDFGLSHGAIVYSEPGRTAVALAVRDTPELFAMLAFATEKTGSDARLSAEEQVERTAHLFSKGGWKAQHLVQALRRADDLYFDTVSQIRMPHWSKGRVALVGDSAFAPSFLSCQGTSLAIVGAAAHRRVSRSGGARRGGEPRKPGFSPPAGGEQPYRNARQAPQSGVHYQNIVMKYAKATGISGEAIGVCVHSMRATAATNVLSNEADIAKVQEWLGHANVSSTRLYDRRKTRPEDSPTFHVKY